MYRLAALALLTAAPPVTAAEPQKRPNVVWIVVDDMSANFSCYGEKTIRTPHVDKLAAGGDAVRQRVRDGPGVFAVPLRSRHRVLPDDDRRPPPPQRPRRTEDPSARRRRPGARAVPPGGLLHRHRRVRCDRREARQDGLQLRVGPRHVRRQRLGRAEAGPAVLHAGATPRREVPRAGAEQELAGASAEGTRVEHQPRGRDAATVLPPRPGDPPGLGRLPRLLPVHGQGGRRRDRPVGEGESARRDGRLLHDRPRHQPRAGQAVPLRRGRPRAVRGPRAGHRQGGRPHRPDRTHRLGRHLPRGCRDRGPEVDAGAERAGEGLREAGRGIRRPRPVR